MSTKWLKVSQIPHGLTKLTDVTTILEPLTLEEIKKWVRMEENIDDSELTRLQKSAREYGESLTRTAFATQSWRLVLHTGFPTGGLFLPKPPLQSVTGIQYLVNGGYVVLAPANYHVEINTMPGGIDWVEEWPETDDRASNVIVEFVCGYTPITFPKPLKEAMLHYITWHYAKRLPDEKEPTWLVKLFKQYRFG